MNRLNSIALLAGGALVAVAATGCSSSTKPAAAGPAASSATTPAGAQNTATPSAPNTAAGGTSALSNGSTTAPAANSSAPSTHAVGGDAPTSAPAQNPAPVSHPLCDNAKLNASLWQDKGQPPTNPVIAVKNTGPTCMINPIPYLWIVKSPTDASDQLRPLVPGGTPGTAKPQTFLSGTTLYAAVDLAPNSAPDTATGYSYLEVTANPTKDSSGKDVQDLRLPVTINVSGPKLGVYATNPSNALNALQYSTTLES